MKRPSLLITFFIITCFSLSKLSGQNGVTVAGGNGYGQAANQFNSPTDIAIDTAGNIYVADYTNQRVQKWAPGATGGVTVAGGNGIGSAANQLHGPSDVFVDGDGNVFVSDIMNNRIQKWAPGATEGITVAGGNGYGPAANQLAYPTAVVLDRTGNIFITDRINHRIQKWAPGASTGVTVAGGNGLGSAANQFKNPTGLFVDTSYNVYVADQDNYRIQKWPPGAAEGITVAGGNGVGSAANQLYPYEVFVDPAGIIYVADRGNDRIQKWLPGASAGITVAGGNGPGPAANQLNNPAGVYVDSSNFIYVADEQNHRIQKFPPAILTVSLLKFEVAPVQRMIKLEWATASEQNNKGFEVQRFKTSLSEYQVIGWLDGKGYSETTTQYSFYDKDVLPGSRYYYRLKQVDRDGNFRYSSIKTMILQGSSNMEVVRIAPNPVTNPLHLYFNSIAEPGAVIIKVLDAQGALVLMKEHKLQGQDKINLNVSGFSTGQYYLLVETNKEVIYSNVFLKR